MKIQTSLLSPSSRQACDYSRISSTGKPSSQDQRKLISDRQSSSLLPGAVTSPIVASNPDGRGAVCSRRSRSACQRGRMLQPRLSRCFHQSSRSALFQIGSALYQLVYEWHFTKTTFSPEFSRKQTPPERSLQRKLFSSEFSPESSLEMGISSHNAPSCDMLKVSNVLCCSLFQEGDSHAARSAY